MRKKLVTDSFPRISRLVVVLLPLCLAPFSSSSLRNADAAVTTAISPTAETGGPTSLGTTITSGTSTVPTNLCAANCVITGGTRVGNNLFHSFGDFSIAPLDSARFQTGLVNPLPDASVSNILGRVTGVNSTNIFGTLDSAIYYPSANLFLMNPHGFLFGPNATVNVGGMVTFTTADYMRLTDGGRFNANPNAIPADLLTAAPVAAFGFLGSNPSAINLEGGQLTVANGAGITLVAGDINLVPDLSDTPSGITASGRQIRLTSVEGPAEVAADTGVPAPGMALGTITLGQGTLLSTAGDPSSLGDGSGGGVSIRGGQLVATGATIITSPAKGSIGTGGDVTISVTGSATIADSIIQTSPVVFSFAGSAGAVSITGNDNLSMTNTTIDAGSFFAGGDAGPVTLQTNGPLFMTDSVILTSASAPGNGGAVAITGKNVTLNNSGVLTDVDTGIFDAASDPAMGQVRPGAVTVTAQNTVTLSGSARGYRIISATAFGTLLDAGSITITGKTVNLSNGTIDATLNDGGIVSPANGGTIEIRGNNVNSTRFELVSNAANIPESSGAGGSILFRGADNLRAENIHLANSSVNTASGGGGGGGKIEFQTKALTLSDNTDVGTSSFGPGPGGTVTVREAENVTIESGSRVLTDVVIGLEGSPQGAAGNILVETQNLTLRTGGIIRAGALPLSIGNAADITVQGTNGPAQSVLIDGTGSGIFSTAEGTGAGGNIFLNANSVTLQNGATVSASSSGLGDAGSIVVTAANGFTMQNSTITTLAGQGASGGDIKVTTAPSATVLLENSRISASVADGPGGGGNISIDPQFVILQNSQILAQAAQGQGGAITITANLFLADANSIVNADSGSGVNGTVTIQSPNDPAGGKIQPLGKSPLQATSLLNQRCAALAGGNFSSFTVAGRDSLPTEPSSWLASPLALGLAGTGGGTLPEKGGRAGIDGDPSRETTVLSLRQIAPAGFLTQAFAVDWSASCQS